MASSSAHQPPPPWGTLENLLLVCAVNRHGLDRWDSVASELHSRSSAPALTPLTCRYKFHDLKRLYAAADTDEEAFDVMVDDLRRLRVEELRREVRRRDVSILSLEMKVKKMEEDRDSPPSDLKATEEASEKLAGKSNSGKAVASDSSSERENRSFNESNSTSQRSDAKPDKKAEPDPDSDPAQPQPPSVIDDVAVPASGRPDDVAVEKEEEMERSNSDVQSSASLSRKKRKRRRSESSDGEEAEGGEEVSPATTKRVKLVKLEPLVNKVLGLVCSHRLGSVFQRRLRIQESQRYKNLIREHVDLQIVQSRLDSGVYKDHTPKFFRDLLLLFSNAVLYYRKAAPEHVAALELRSLVLKEMNDRQSKAQSTVGTTVMKMKPNVESDVTTTTTTSTMRPSKSKSSSLVACGKRGSINALSENKKGIVRKVEDIANVKVEEKGVRKRRVPHEKRGGGRPRTMTSNMKNIYLKTNESSGNDEARAHEGSEVVKTEKKEDVKKRQQGVASFLKRMQQNGGGEVGQSSNGSEDESKDSMVDEDEEEEEAVDEEEDEKKKKKTSRKKSDTKEKKERAARGAGGNRGRRGGRGQESCGRGKRGVGRPHKKQETTTAVGSVKRGRDNGDTDKVGSAGRPRKRTRR